MIFALKRTLFTFTPLSLTVSSCSQNFSSLILPLAVPVSSTVFVFPCQLLLFSSNICVTNVQPLRRHISIFCNKIFPSCSIYSLVSVIRKCLKICFKELYKLRVSKIFPFRYLSREYVGLSLIFLGLLVYQRDLICFMWKTSKGSMRIYPVSVLSDAELSRPFRHEIKVPQLALLYFLLPYSTEKLKNFFFFV